LGKKEMHTARGSGEFLVYEGAIDFAEQTHIIPIITGAEITEVLLGLKWLENYKLIVDRKANLLTLEL
jgi:predicted aspartyl protease